MSVINTKMVMSGRIKNDNYVEILIPFSKLTSSQASSWIIYVRKIYVYAVADLRERLGGPGTPCLDKKEEMTIENGKSQRGK